VCAQAWEYIVGEDTIPAWILRLLSYVAKSVYVKVHERTAILRPKFNKYSSNGYEASLPTPKDVNLPHHMMASDSNWQAYRGSGDGVKHMRRPLPGRRPWGRGQIRSLLQTKQARMETVASRSEIEDIILMLVRRIRGVPLVRSKLRSWGLNRGGP
jgi:hypothetical protein